VSAAGGGDSMLLDSGLGPEGSLDVGGGWRVRWLDLGRVEG
jgi:hypothetical protein